MTIYYIITMEEYRVKFGVTKYGQEEDRFLSRLHPTSWPRTERSQLVSFTTSEPETEELGLVLFIYSV